MSRSGKWLHGEEAGKGRSDFQSFRNTTGWIGSAPCFLRALDELERFAQITVPVLIIGETGTGKELAARAIHYLGRKGDGPFVPVNCGALPERLFENELFGHARGAFTDAGEATRGLIAHAEGGTLLLDEIDCLDRHSQAALLRFLQDYRYRPLGSGSDRVADVRIVASSNTRLPELVETGQFRRDLLFRLDVARVELPPLRERGNDIVELARHFLALGAKRFSRPCPHLSAASEAGLRAHDWPGNVRELENTMLRLILLAGDSGELAQLPQPLQSVRPNHAEPPPIEQSRSQQPAARLKDARSLCLARFEREYLSNLLARTHGNIAAASREAGTERRHLGRMIQRHAIDVGSFRG